MPRFHLDGIDAGRWASLFKFDPGTSEKLGLLATATVGEGGWVDPTELHEIGKTEEGAA